MNAARALLLTLLIGTPVRMRAQQADVPPLLSRVLALLQKDSIDAATVLMSRTWTSPVDSGKADIIRQALKDTRQNAGPFRGFDVAKTEVITPHLRRLYVVMLYERGPVYGQFLLYDPGITPAGWQVQFVNWNSDVEKVWPPSLLSH